MTQTDLAGDRFSKEYVSQIERGKTRPTRETIDWLAQRLGVDAGFLANGVSADERGRVDAALARADALLEARRNDEALEEFESIRAAVLATGMQELEARALSGEATVRMRRGEVREAIALLERARALTEGTSFSDVERADVALPARRRPLQAQQHPDGDRPVRRGAQARRALGDSVGPAALEHSCVALALLPPAPRPRGRARGRRARARARRRA